MKKLMYKVGAVVVVVAAIWLARPWTRMTVNARLDKLDVDVRNLFDGLQQYKEHVGSYPTGSNAQVVKALHGQNPKNVIILVSRKNELNTKGEFVDPWGTPLRIYFSENSVLVRSAGQNQRFDDTTAPEFDDYVRSN